MNIISPPADTFDVIVSLQNRTNEDYMVRARFVSVLAANDYAAHLSSQAEDRRVVVEDTQTIGQTNYVRAYVNGERVAGAY